MTKHVTLKKTGLFIWLFLLPLVQLFAQKTEIGGLVGPTYYWGDINNNLQFRNIRLGGSAFIRYHLSPRYSLRANLSYARVTGADSISRGSSWQINRNLSFWTDIFEISGIVEYNLRPDDNMGRKVTTRGIPYVYGGLGLFHFNPKSNNPITGEVVELQPLKLNGVSYSKNAICIPIGVGYRYYLNRKWQIGVELGMRYSLSSYVDDIDGNSIYPEMKSLESDDARIMWSTSTARINEIKRSGTTYVAGPQGKNRGKNEIVSDVYFIGGVTVSYRLWPGQTIRCPRVY
jgi:hypothetical protein